MFNCPNSVNRLMHKHCYYEHREQMEKRRKIMWRLTIYQKKVTTYTDNGEEKSYDTEDSVVYESEHFSRLSDIIEAMDGVYQANETRYEIRKVVD